jgi:UDPglucose 6-dehydrogenase
MKIAVFGSGYVGLVVAAGFADAGHRVLCVDIDDARVAALRAGDLPFFEPGLREMMDRSVRGDRLRFSTTLDEEHRGSQIYFVAVGTSSLPDGRADLRGVWAAVEVIRAQATAPAVIGVKSTVPVGTCDEIQRALGDDRLRVASVPEFLKEGSALDDFLKPDRVVLGVAHPEAERTLRELYRPLQLASDRILVMDRRSSELAKYAANALLAARISFMNEMSRLCDEVGADVHAIRRAVGSDRRIGPQFLYAGPGFGGSCFAKDLSALGLLARDAGVPLEVVEAVVRANEAQRAYVIEKALALLGPHPAGKVVAVWGLAFKPQTDDVRESPAAPLIAALRGRGLSLRAHDPEAGPHFLRDHGGPLDLFESEYEAAEGADLVVLMTEWRHLRNPDFDRLARLMRTPALLDARNVWSTFQLNQRGFRYAGVGTAAGRASSPS